MSQRVAGRFVALFRGINVGRAKRIAMADLRSLFEELGFTDVKTLLNSGNVVFASRSSPSESRIEKALTERLGVSARVTVLTAEEVAAIVDGNPLAPAAKSAPSRFLVAVPREPEGRKLLLPLAKKDWSPEALAVGPRVAYLFVPAGVLDSRTFEAVEKTLGNAVTSRNWATMSKLRALLDDAGAAPARSRP